MSEFTQNILIFIVIFGDGDVEVDKLAPAGVEDLVHKSIFVSVSPEGDEGIVILTAGILVFLIKDVIQVEPVESFPKSIPLFSLRVAKLY